MGYKQKSVREGGGRLKYTKRNVVNTSKCYKIKASLRKWFSGQMHNVVSVFTPLSFFRSFFLPFLRDNL